ncbi:MAG: DUF4062 domain-containing protein [Breznakibacter sp.]
MKKKLQIFISSTYIDMKEERQSAVEAILKSGNIPAGMELFTAGNESQLQTIMRWIDESDIYVLLLGGRYGSIEKSSGLSYTEVEYDYAVSQKKPYFSIVITEDALDNKTKNHGKTAIENEEPKKFSEFRKKVLSNTSSFYSELKDIKLAIHETLQDFKERYNFSGWVSGKTMEENEVLLEENRVLRLKLEDLQKFLDSQSMVESKVNSNEFNENNDFEDLIEIFSNMIITTDVFGEMFSEPKDYRLIDILVSKKSTLINGVTNKVGMTNISRLFFFNIFPKLAVHELADNLALQGVQYRMFKLNKKGLRFLAYYDKKRFKK